MSFDAIPHGRTARRLTWPFLPVNVRAEIERRLGSEVVEATSHDAGFTPGLASMLTGADGSRVFVKAASRTAQPMIAQSYAEEARKLGLLKNSVPAPRLLWTFEDEWVVLGLEPVEAHAPQRPWIGDELARALDVAEKIAAATASIPPGLRLDPLVQDVPRMVTGWDDVEVSDPDWPHLGEARALAHAFAALPADRFTHADLRDDNILLVDGGTDLACDWNWPALAPAWIDLVVLLVSAYADGHDADTILSERSLTKDVSSDEIDAWLAALAGFMLASRDLPAPTNSPWLRVHADAYGTAAWAWLSERRGWT